MSGIGSAGAVCWVSFCEWEMMDVDKVLSSEGDEVQQVCMSDWQSPLTSPVMMTIHMGHQTDAGLNGTVR